MTFEIQNSPKPTYNVHRSERALLWARLEAAHAKLSMEPPTATLTIEELRAEVERLEGEVGSLT